MKNIFLSVVVMSALIAAGVGGTLADFNDYEVSEDNTFQMGGMDLTISDGTGKEFNGYNNIPQFFAVTAGWPECSKDRSWDIHNAGNNEQEAPKVYIHFKNLDCEWVDCKTSQTTPFAYMAVENDSVVRYDADGADRVGINEPQDVAIFGGVAGEDADGAPVTVPGIGDDAICLLSRTIRVVAIGYSEEYDSVAPLRDSWDAVVLAGEDMYLDLSPYDKNSDGVVTLDEVICEQIYMFTLTGCKMRWMNMSLRAVDINEDQFEDAAGAPLDLFPVDSKWEN